MVLEPLLQRLNRLSAPLGGEMDSECVRHFRPADACQGVAGRPEYPNADLPAPQLDGDFLGAIRSRACFRAADRVFRIAGQQPVDEDLQFAKLFLERDEIGHMISLS